MESEPALSSPSVDGIKIDDQKPLSASDSPQQANSATIPGVSGQNLAPDPNIIPEPLLDKALEQLINKLISPPAEFRNPLFQLLSRRKISAIVSGDYAAAEEYEKDMAALARSSQNEDEKEMEDRKIDQLYTRYQLLQRGISDTNRKYDQKVALFLDEDEKRAAALKERHEKEAEDFRKQWSDPSFLLTFNKPSSQLLQLREQEKAMAISKLYSRAREMKTYADKRQKLETAQAQNRIEEQMNIERQKMDQRHKKENERLQRHREDTLKMLNTEREAESKPFIAAIQQIQMKRPNTATQRPQSEFAPPMSPRTQEIYLKFRSERSRTRLKVAPSRELSCPTEIRRPRTASERRRKTELI